MLAYIDFWVIRKIDYILIVKFLSVMIQGTLLASSEYCTCLMKHTNHTATCLYPHSPSSQYGNEGNVLYDLQ